MSFVRTKKHPDKNIYQKCYTKKAFYKRHWTEETIHSRGHVFDEYGSPLAIPMPKLFNIDEHESTSRDEVIRRIMEDEDRQLEMHVKLNGHLSILFHDGDDWINTTRGSFEHEFIGPDRELIEKAGFNEDTLEKLPKTWTFMFEIIGEHDRHLLTDTTIKFFDGPIAALLGVNDRETGASIHTADLLDIDKFGCDLRSLFLYESVRDAMDMHYDAITEENVSDFLDMLLGGEETEGFVIFDPVDNWRVKLKTYWFIRNRYLFQFNHEKTKNIFLQHLDTEEAFNKIPEELYPQYEALLDAYEIFFDKSIENAMDYLMAAFDCYKQVETVETFIRATEDLLEEEKAIILLYMHDNESYEQRTRAVFVERAESLSLVE